MVDIEEIRALAKAKNLSLTQLEKEAGIANGVIGKWKTNSPNIDTLLKVCNVLGCNADQLIRKEAEDATSVLDE